MIKIISSKILKISDGHDYSSTQIELPQQISSRIIKWGKKEISDSDLFDDDGTKGRESNIHVTVKYGLHTTDVENIKKVVNNFGSFKVVLGEITRFINNDDFDVVKLSVESPPLRELHNILNKLKNSDEYDIYKPHITVAYVKSGTHSDLSGNREFAGESFTARVLTFNSKTGKSHSIKL